MNNKIKAFTLIELLVVISIVGIISGIVVVQMNGAINATKDATKKTDLNTIKKALTIYQAETGKAYPSEAGCTIGSCTNLDSALDGIIPDSFANTYTYSSNGTSYTISSVLSSGYAYQYNSSTNEYSTLEPTNGSCGSSNGANLSSQPSTNLCTVGTASSVSGSGPWNWTCIGTNGGTTASCATGGVPVAGVCGSKNGKYASSTPTGTEACATGTVSGMAGSYSWTCAGANGGASSGTCTTVAATYNVTSFTTTGTSSWTVPAGITSVEYLVVGGGGGAGGLYCGGGGGGGGYLTGTTSVTPGNSVAIEVGAGGTSIYAINVTGGAGGQSRFGSIIAAGGGGGGCHYATAGASGGSGGGGGGHYPTSGSGGAGGAASAGNSGGSGSSGDGERCRGGGGGGGAGGAGGNATTSAAGAGGAGIQNSITGTSVWYAGGGGGGGYNATGGSGTRSNGGGGDGEYYNGSYHYFPSTKNGIDGTGGGAGAWDSSGGSASVGGSGIVVVRYVTNY